MVKKILKSIYRAVPFKKQIFKLIKLAWIPPSNITQHLHFNAPVKVNVEKKAAFNIHHYGYIIENELFWYGIEGGWEKASFKLWKELSKNAKTIFDIGANTGVYSLISGSVNPDAKIYAFEPINSVYKKLIHNVQLNSFKNNVSAKEIALSNYTGEAVIYLEKNATHSLSVAVNKSLLANDIDFRTEKIKTITLGQFIEENKINKIDLIKIDVETHEPEVLEGMGIYLRKFKPTLLIEILNDEIGKKVEQLIQGIDYLYFNIDEQGGTVEEATCITKSKYYNYLICSKEIAILLKLV